jgi:hypothetical protein
MERIRLSFERLFDATRRVPHAPGIVRASCALRRLCATKGTRAAAMMTLVLATGVTHAKHAKRVVHHHAAAATTPGAGTDVGIIFAVLLFVIGFAVAVKSSRTRIDGQLAQQKRDQDTAAQAQLDAFNAAPLPRVAAPFTTLAGEQCYRGDAAQKVMNVKERVGAYGGPSVRVARGLYIRAGTSRSRSTETAPEVVDSGDLYVTNQRAVFIGQRGTEVYAWSHVIAWHGYSDGIAIDVPNKPRVTFVTGVPETAWTVDRISRSATSNDASANRLSAN